MPSFFFMIRLVDCLVNKRLSIFSASICAVQCFSILYIHFFYMYIEICVSSSSMSLLFFFHFTCFVLQSESEAQMAVGCCGKCEWAVHFIVYFKHIGMVLKFCELEKLLYSNGVYSVRLPHPIWRVYVKIVWKLSTFFAWWNFNFFVMAHLTTKKKELDNWKIY